MRNEKIAIVAVLSLCALAFAQAPCGDTVGTTNQNRVSASEKGSILIFPKIEVRWAAEGDPSDPVPGDLIGDTFIDIANDLVDGNDVHIEMFYVNDQCDKLPFDTELTPSQPKYWAASSGDGGVTNLIPFWTVADAELDPLGSGDFVVRGYLVVIATDPLRRPIRHNHLYGQATIINYSCGTAWEYNAYAFAALQGSQGGLVPGVTTGGTGAGAFVCLPLNSVIYDSGFDFLLLDFIASGSTAFSGGGQTVTHDTDLTLMILRQDLRQETEGPFRTKAVFLIWDEEEDSAAFEFCFTKWTQVLLSNFGPSSPFDIDFLGTNKGRAIINGDIHPPCNIPPNCQDDDPNAPNYDFNCIETCNYSLLGVQAKVLTFSGDDPSDPSDDLFAMAGGNLTGTGNENTTICYNVLVNPTPELNAGVAPVAPTPSAPVIRFRR